MNPNKKAVLIYNKFMGMPFPTHSDRAKQCALICVDEIILSSPSLPILSDNGTYGSDIEESKVFWLEVKQELKNL